MLTQNQKSLKQAWHDLFWRDCVFCLYISRMFYLFLKFWSLAGFSLNMDDSSLFPSSYHHHQNLFSLFLFFIFVIDSITLSNQVSLVSFSGTQIIPELKLQPWPSHLPSSLLLLYLSFPTGSDSVTASDCWGVSFLLHGFHCREKFCYYISVFI